MAEQRWRFASDEDGHHYLIPVELKEEFDEWLENVYGGKNWKGTDFNSYICSIHTDNYSFTNPEEI